MNNSSEGFSERGTKKEWGQVQSVECEDSEDSRVLREEFTSSVKGVKRGLWSVKCRV